MKQQAKLDARRTTWRAEQQLTDGERAALARSVEELRAAIASARAAWPATTEPIALAALVPGESACEYRFQAPTAAAANSYLATGSIDAAYFGTQAFGRYPAGTTPPDHQLGAFAAEVEEVARRIAQHIADRSDSRRLTALGAHIPFVMMDDVARGRGYVFSVSARRIVCVGSLDLGLHLDPRAVEVGLRRALASELREVARP
jgi:hypothetical protein